MICPLFYTNVTLSLLQIKGRTRAECESWAKEEGINRRLGKTVTSNSLICDPHQIFFGLSNKGWDGWDV